MRLPRCKLVAAENRMTRRNPSMRNTIAMLIGAAMLPMATLVSAQAPTYPDKPIRIVVPFPVGGIADTFGREIARKLTQAWGQPVVIDNRPGAGGNIGADIGAKSPPDGYTLVIGNIGTHAVNVSLLPAMPFDTIRDFTPIVHVLDAEGLLVVNPSILKDAGMPFQAVVARSHRSHPLCRALFSWSRLIANSVGARVTSNDSCIQGSPGASKRFRASDGTNPLAASRRLASDVASLAASPGTSALVPHPAWASDCDRRLFETPDSSDTEQSRECRRHLRANACLQTAGPQ